MTKDELFYELLNIAEQNYCRISGNKTHRFSLNEKRVLQIENLVNLIFEKVNNDSIGNDFVKDFISFVFSKSVGRTNFLGIKDLPMFNQIFSRTAFNQYQKTEHWKKLYGKRNLSKIAKKTNLILTSEEKEKRNTRFLDICLKVSNTEETEKSRFHGSQKGYQWCINFTTLYKPTSELCVNCVSKDKCKELLKENFPKIFEVRINAREI